MTPDRADNLQQARRLAAAGRFAEAEDLVRRSSSKPAKDAEGLRLRGFIAMLADRGGEARSLLQKSLKIEPSADAHLLLAQYHLRMVENDAAIDECRRALSLAPDDASARIQVGAIMVELGRAEEAADALAPLAERPPADPRLARRAAITLASVEIQRRELDAAIARLQAVLREDLPPTDRHGALDLLAKAFDRTGRHDDAWQAADEGHSIDAVEVDPDRVLAEVDRIIAASDRTSLESMPLGPSDSRPVFIAGMPRSGTSLVDRIVDAHPRAAGVGERPVLERAAAAIRRARTPASSGVTPRGDLSGDDWSRLAGRTLDDLAAEAPPDAERIVDKSLANDRLLGIASRLLPGSRVIHVIRDPRDVAVSCFLGRFNPEKHPWTTSIEGIAAAWTASRRLMDHWSATIDLPILEVRYERLVRDPDHEFPRIVEFLGLDWDDACRRFHETGRPLRTLSFDQVSRPLYTTSVGRHTAYDRHLAGVEWPSYDPDA